MSGAGWRAKVWAEVGELADWEAAGAATSLGMAAVGCSREKAPCWLLLLLLQVLADFMHVPVASPCISHYLRVLIPHPSIPSRVRAHADTAYLHEVDAALVACCSEAGHVANYAAAECQEGGTAVQAALQGFVPNLHTGRKAGGAIQHAVVCV